MKTFLLPDLGEGLKEAVITEWMAAAGEFVAQGRPMLAVETAKSVVEIPSPYDLVLDRRLALTGDTVAVGQPLFAYSNREPASKDGACVKAADRGSVVGSLDTTAPEQQDRLLLTGTQRYSADEKRRARQQLTAQPALSYTKIVAPALLTSTDAAPLTGTRLQMSRQLSAAHREVVQVTVFDEAPLGPDYRPLLPKLVHSLCRACKDVPEANSWMQQETLLRHEHVQLGLAVDTDYGLVVPVLHDADLLDLRQIQHGLRVLSTKARTQQLNAGDSRGATLSLSSYGSLGGRYATPLVVPPQVVILGAGKIREEYRLNRRGKAKQVRYLPLSLSFDHRALTGAEAIRFMQAVCYWLAASSEKKGRP